MSNKNFDLQPKNVRPWKLATILATCMAIVMGTWANIQSDRVEQAEAQLRITEERLVQALKPNLPISVSFRPALLGSGLVAIFKNQQSSSIEFTAEFTSTATGAARSANIVLDSNSVKEIGHAEGWPFAAGQHIRLTNNQFRPAEYEVPGI